MYLPCIWLGTGAPPTQMNKLPLLRYVVAPYWHKWACWHPFHHLIMQSHVFSSSFSRILFGLELLTFGTGPSYKCRAVNYFKIVFLLSQVLNFLLTSVFFTSRDFSDEKERLKYTVVWIAFIIIWRNYLMYLVRFHHHFYQEFTWLTGSFGP